MEANSVTHEDDNEEEYVLLDLDSVSGQLDIPPNAPYALSGLDTLNPVLTIGGLKLIGDYEETIGTCLVFTEEDAEPVVPEETGPSEENLFSGKCIIDPNQPPIKQVKAMTSLHKILRFRLATDEET
ncbi:TFIIIC transcription factor [Parasponia andersonii]|uniref:TFIIIC transcription factor n=1 Tax=Parasponia andersonii TaxID=3476 RepID=A0A2P5C518_PARAD|nr:TFIIIC transcription factor [Parasponia andersonii]